MKVGSARHLVGRFFGMLDPRGPSAADDAWVRSTLTADELKLWDRMSRADRRHAAGVARRVQAGLGPHADAPVLAAALLHDVGKIESRLGVYGRVVATLCAAFADPSTAAAWQRRRGFTRRVGLYLRHPEIGADLLALAGSDPLTVAWARQHHLPSEQWTLEARTAAVLKAADDD